MNDGMGEYVASQVVKLMLKKGIQVLGSHILILGITFKENCPDVRNTKVVDIIRALREYNVNVTIYDPWANPGAVKREYGLDIETELPANRYEAIVLAVAHEKFRDIRIGELKAENAVVYDVKNMLPHELSDGRL